jgi:hypothetical protein
MAAFPRARSSRRVILNQDQRIRLDGVALPLTQNDLCESAYDVDAETEELPSAKAAPIERESADG